MIKLFKFILSFHARRTEDHKWHEHYVNVSISGQY